MSPVFGGGVNNAIEDAVAAARFLAPPLLTGQPTDAAVHRVQRRRQWPVRLMQPLQQRVHRLLSAPLRCSLENMAGTFSDFGRQDRPAIHGQIAWP